MIKVVLISQDFFPMNGGIARYLMQIYKKYLSETNFEAIIPIALIKDKSIAKLPFKVHGVDFKPFNINDKYREKANKQILCLVNKIKPDILLLGYLRSHPEIALIYKKFNPKSKFGIFIHAKEAFIDSCIINKNNTNGIYQRGYTKLEAKFYKKILNLADFIFTVSKFSRNLLIKQNILKKNISVLNPALSKDYGRNISFAKDKLGFTRKDIILSVGRLVKRKGHAEIIKIMSKLIKRFPELIYLIVGNGPEITNLKKMILKTGLEKKVFIYPKISDDQLPLFYSACDIFVLPSKFIKPNDIEGFGIVFLEASSFKKPVIGLDSGGVSEAIINNKTGYVIKKPYSLNLEKKIIKLLSNKLYRRRFGENGRKNVINRFNDAKSSLLLKKFKKDNSQT
ncbi:MAG: glycosyltransferase family 4 protein [Nanoarchaeota archaeon]